MTRIDQSLDTAPELFACAPSSVHLDAHRDPAQWHQAMGVARQACARIFRDGGGPADALRAFGLPAARPKSGDWSKAVGLIAETLCRAPMRKAA